MDERVPEEILEKARELRLKHELLANEVRLLILATLAVRGAATWSQLKSSLEELLGRKLNPNVLAFHLGKLLEAGAVEKKVVGSEAYYQAAPGWSEESEIKQLAKIVEKALEAEKGEQAGSSAH